MGATSAPSMGPRVRRAAPESWVRRHELRIQSVLDAVCGAGLVVAAFLFGGEVVVNEGLAQPGFVLLWVFAGLWGAARTILGLLTADPEDPTPGETRARRADAPRRRTPWWLRLGAIVVAMAVAAPLGAQLLPAEPDPSLGLAQGSTLSLFLALIAMLCGVVVALLGVALALIGWGVWIFGRATLTGRGPDGSAVDRKTVVSPFIACLGLLGLPLALAGLAAYDSPYRRDYLPLLGVVRDGVEVTQPALLLVAQVATWAMLLGVGAGSVVFRLSRRAARRG